MLKFKQDEHGLMFENKQGQVWILPRPSYCDRGRFEWGQNGFLENVPKPSYYFFSLEAAQEEVSSFIFATSSGLFPHETEKDLSSSLVSNHNLIAHPEKPSSWMKLVPWPDGTTKVMSLSLVTTDFADNKNETLWEISEGTMPFVDHSDQFPRYFRFVKNALSELDAFISCRQAQALQRLEERSPSSSQPKPR